MSWKFWTWFSKPKKNAEGLETKGLKPVKVKKLGYASSQAAKKKPYIVKAAVTFNGKPTSTIEFKHEHYSRDMAAKDVQDNIGIKVISAHEDARGKK